MEEVKKDLLDRNGNATPIIYTIWASSVATIILGFIFYIFPKYKNGEIIIKELVLFLVLFVLSAISLMFYYKVIRRIKESTWGRYTSIGLSSILLLLVALCIFFPFFIFIGIGMFLICIKTLLLYIEVTKKNMGKIIIKYFRKIFISYIFLTVIVIYFCYYADSNNVNFFSTKTNNTLYHEALAEVLKIQETNSVNLIIEKITELNEELIESKKYNQFVLLFLFSSFILIFFYLLYKVPMIRKNNLDNIYSELANYYGEL